MENNLEFLRIELERLESLVDSKDKKIKELQDKLDEAKTELKYLQSNVLTFESILK